jgi:PhnB protein
MTPQNYSTVCPYLMVNSIEVQMEFLKSAFDGIVKESLKNAEGIIMHGEVIIGDSVIMMGRGGAEFPSQASMNYVFVSDVNQIYKTALELGAISMFEPADRFYGIREGGFKDMHNNTWFIAQPFKVVSAEDMEKGFADKKA